MSADTLIEALVLPASSRVSQRVPKKLLLENGASTAADRRVLNDGIEDVHWVAALKPTTIGVPAYRDDVREYLEVAVLSVTFRGNAKLGRVAELVHRAVPYPMVLLLNSEQTLMLALAHKRWAQNEAGKVVLDGAMVEVALSGAAPSSAIEIAFMQTLALARQPQATLYALYQGWMDNLEALLAARLTGSFKDASSPEEAAARRQGLQDCQRLELEAVSLRAKAAKEKQLARQVELNLTLKRVQAQLAAARKQL